MAMDGKLSNLGETHKTQPSFNKNMQSLGRLGCKFRIGAPMMSAREGYQTGNMNNDGFDPKILSEKLSKLNNSQQSIESLSRWCISNRKKARHIVETWEKMFNSSQKEKHVSFLYLANDILQNSRKKGSEYVNEFWKVLPIALKYVWHNGDESGKKAATRLVDIWEERKVFGSRVQTLKDELVAIHVKNPPLLAVCDGKTVNPIKIVKKDAESLSIKLAVGGFYEKNVSAFHSLHNECSDEESVLTKCNAAAVSVEKIVKDIEMSTSQGIQPGTGVADEMQEHSIVLQQCVKQLEGAESYRASLVSLLNEVIKDQELRLETLRCQLQIALSRINEVCILKSKLSSHDHSVSATPIPASTKPPSTEELNNPGLLATTHHIPSSLQLIVGKQQIPPVPQFSQIPTSFAGLEPASSDEEKKAAAAAVAAKLFTSTSSSLMLASVLSKLAAEETASMNNSLSKVGISSSSPIFSPEKRQKLEQPPCPGTDPADIDGGSLPYSTPLPQPNSRNQVLQSNVQASLGPPLPSPPPPSLLPMNSAPNQFSQSADMPWNMMPPYGFGSSSLPPPPLSSHVAMGLARPIVSAQSSQLLQPPQQLDQQQNAGGGFYHPPGIRLQHGETSQLSTPPVCRQ